MNLEMNMIANGLVIVGAELEQKGMLDYVIEFIILRNDREGIWVTYTLFTPFITQGIIKVIVMMPIQHLVF